MSSEAKVLAGISVATLVIVVGAAFMFGGKTSPEKVQPVSAEMQKMLIREDSHKKGATKGKVTVVEFGDFQCPACGSAHPIVKELTEVYKDQVTFVFREFPLPMHKNAKVAALAAEAAGAQGKFFEMHDMLFETQQAWSEKDNAEDIFVQYGQKLKLDIDKFKADMKDPKLEDKIQKDMADGNGVGVNATPTFYINGVQQSGGLPYEEFKTKIDTALKEAK